MAISGRQTNTMEEHLQKMLRMVTDAKIAPDADLEFLVNMETMILQRLKAPAAAVGATSEQTQVPGQGPMPPEMVGAAMGGFSPSPGPGVPGLRSGAMIPQDELRRMVGG